jgi:hyperosmotically inducible protein
MVVTNPHSSVSSRVEKHLGFWRIKKIGMSKIRKGLLAVVAALIVAMPASVLADPSTSNPQLAQKVRHELVMLPYYGVFDNLAYSINGGTVTLYGQVVRASTRSDAERAIKRLPGVTEVKNNIKVLPLSGFDNNIRGAVYRSIARMGGLYRYLQGGNPSLHIVVDSGHVTLEGMVSSNSDKNLAYLAANQVGGIFSVTNNLRVESEQPR